MIRIHLFRNIRLVNIRWNVCLNRNTFLRGVVLLVQSIVFLLGGVNGSYDFGIVGFYGVNFVGCDRGQVFGVGATDASADVNFGTTAVGICDLNQVL